jgi:hypothetical protein
MTWQIKKMIAEKLNFKECRGDRVSHGLTTGKSVENKMIDLVDVEVTTLKCYNGLFILMNQRILFSAASALVLSLGLLFSVSADMSPLYG